MTREEVGQLLGNVPAIMVRITQLYNSNSFSHPPTKDELYDITRWAWTVSAERAQNAHMIIGVAKDAKTGVGSVVSAYEISKCDLVGNVLRPVTRLNDPEVANDLSENERVAFEGTPVSGTLQASLLGRTVGEWFLDGHNHPLPFEYFNC